MAVSRLRTGSVGWLMRDILPHPRLTLRLTPRLIPRTRRGPAMSALLLLTSALQPSAEVLPGLALLSHTVKIVPAQGSALLDAPDSDLVLVDGRQDLAAARDLCRLIRTTGTDAPVLLIVTEGGLAVVAHDWGMDVVVHVRRLRAKLGTEHEHHIGTVRNVGYRFVVPTRDPAPETAPSSTSS